VWCWGANDSGQLGDGTRRASATPVRATLFDGATSLALGNAHTCWLDGAQHVRCIGARTSGQVGDGAPLVGTAPGLAPITCP
jgi:alpha-tubulin suppressor-like RCC1 family protein